ncbi:F-box domain containing protein [Melia azedarach]|uniref:F-box domain containing protein n=1 Tax=Melia azedarach TaxID=155640 RepID=A0ACC1YH56_MELAZ|nr:F-box domain containing protein [Melia azedarach]
MELKEVEESKNDVISEVVEMNRRGKKRKSRRKREKITEQATVELPDPVKEVVLQDPLEVFGGDIMLMIVRNLDARSVVLSLLVSRGWHSFASSDSLWTSKCEELWLGKAHLPRLALVPGLPKLAAYSLSVMDGKRNRIMKEDLCDHVWEYHFNKVVPEYWLNLDPYWKGTRPLMHRHFHLDGSQTADPGDTVWGGHECCYTIVTSVVGEGKLREHYVRINHWPHMFVSRKLDWSWEMSNRIYCYSSVPDANREGGTGPLPALVEYS